MRSGNLGAQSAAIILALGVPRSVLGSEGEIGEVSLERALLGRKGYYFPRYACVCVGMESSGWRDGVYS